MSAVKNAVVQRFKSLCSERGIAANELANISGMTPSTVYSLFDEKSSALTGENCRSDSYNKLWWIRSRRTVNFA